MQRRQWMQRLLAFGGAGLLPTAHATGFAYAPVLPGTALRFPQDFGSHPEHRIEWWYVTGWLERKSGPACGFQVTFFRVRTPLAETKNRFTPVQLLFAHAAVSDPRIGHILHAERAARAGFGLAEAQPETTAVWIRDWQLRHNQATTSYEARIIAPEFALDLSVRPTQPILLQGNAGFSQKGPSVTNASFYYSEPQLRVQGEIVVRGKREAVVGTAWLDHEWSSALLPAAAGGWDWLGLNLDDGGALMAFQMRLKDPGAAAPLWSAAKQRQADGSISAPPHGQIQMEALRRWSSPRGARYPVEARFTTGTQTIWLRPLFDAQELHSSVMGNTYWEGAVSAFDGVGTSARRIGRGYWELTGYERPIRV